MAVSTGVGVTGVAVPLAVGEGEVVAVGVTYGVRVAVGDDVEGSVRVGVAVGWS